jgi:Uma2 family endonuclease
MSTDHYTFTEPLVIHMGPLWSQMSGDEFFDFCQRNRDLRLECTSTGDLIVMTPTGGESGRRNMKLGAAVVFWNEAVGLGEVFDSSTGFDLPNGSKRSPDCAWVARDRWERLTQKQRDRFPPIAPDFVLELRSPSDSLSDLQAKMREYVECGVRLGWLIDPETRRVWIYQPDSQPVQLDNPATIEGGTILPGFVLNLATIWS